MKLQYLPLKSLKTFTLTTTHYLPTTCQPLFYSAACSIFPIFLFSTVNVIIMFFISFPCMFSLLMFFLLFHFCFARDSLHVKVFFLYIWFGNTFLRTQCICSHVFTVDKSLRSRMLSHFLSEVGDLCFRFYLFLRPLHVLRQAWTLEF